MTWTLCSAGGVFLMQAGFQLYIAGTLKKKYHRFAMLKNYIGVCLSAIFFYLIGYGIGFGDVNKHSKFAGKN